MVKLNPTILIGLLLIAATIYFSLNPHLIQKLRKYFWVWRLKHNKSFMDGVRRGLDAYHKGKTKPWSEIKKELGL